MMLEHKDNSDHDMNEEDSELVLPLLSEKSNFLENLINGKNGKPKNTIAVNNKSQANFLELLESTINTLRGGDKSNTDSEVAIKNLDPSQVWALIEDFSKDYAKDIKKYNDKISKPVIAELKEAKKSLSFLNKKQQRDDEDAKVSKKSKKKLNEEDLNASDNFDEEGEIDEIEDDINNEDNEEDLNNEEAPQTYNNKRTNKKDMFFDLAEMNKFADELEDDRVPDKKNDDDEELEHDEEEDQIKDENEEFKYEDFFDAPEKNKKTKKNEDEEFGQTEINDEYMEDDIFDIENKIIKNKSKEVEEKYKFINKDTQDTIEEIEQKMMSDKQWHMKGEVTSRERPKGSLLENFLDFEASVKPPPIPTAEYTNNIEKLIKSRIKDELYDDPIRKNVEVNTKKSDFELNFQKDKKGLAEIYEEDYEKNVMKLSSQTEISAAKKEIDDLCTKVYTIFDKLTNNNFISGSRHNEMKVITNIPSIQLEEISNYVTDNKSNAKSANEIYSAKDAQFKTRDELTTDERKQAHKNWKRNVRGRLRENVRNKKLKNLMQNVDSKFEAKMIMKQEKSKKAALNAKNSELKSSKFFGNLQKIATDDINKKKRRDEGKEENNFGGENKVVKKFKL